MGLEWHNRKRNSRGRFAPRAHSTQVHVYCTDAEWRAIRGASLMACEDMSEFCRRAAIARAEALIRGGTRDNQPFSGEKTVSTDG